MIENYKQWAGLRDVFLNLTQNMAKGKSGNEEKGFEKLLYLDSFTSTFR